MTKIAPTHYDENTAMAEGWLLCSTDAGIWEIQRWGECVKRASSLDSVQHGLDPFPDDLHAQVYVREMGALGSRMHLEAWEFHATRLYANSAYDLLFKSYLFRAGDEPDSDMDSALQTIGLYLDRTLEVRDFKRELQFLADVFTHASEKASHEELPDGTP